jgi:hypothetical protein
VFGPGAAAHFRLFAVKGPIIQRYLSGGAEGYEVGEWRSCSAYRPGTSWGTWRRYRG